MNDIATKIAQWLLQINAIQLRPQNPFTWSSGILSPIYCDNRITLSYPEIRKALVQAFTEAAKEFDTFDLVSGVATAGIPHGALLAYEMNLPFAYVRSKAKEHGQKNQIEGRILPGQRVLVAEDLTSTGGSSLSVVDAIRKSEAEVVGVLAIFSYGFDTAAKSFEAANCPLHALSNYDTLLQIAVNQNYISADDLAALSAWKIAPEQWQPKEYSK